MSEIKSHETPRFEINLEKIQANYNDYRDSFSKGNLNCIVAYAIKANYDYQIIKLLNSLGSHFEISAPYEMDILDQLSIPREKIIINGCFADCIFINSSIKSGSLFFLDSISQIDFLEDDVEIGLRINYDEYKKDDPSYRAKKSRFGISIKELDICMRKLSEKRISVIAVNMHTSGNDRSPHTYRNALLVVKHLKESFCFKELRYLDLGGGYKIDKQYWSVDDYVCEIKNAVREFELENYKLIIEPGNSIVRTACSYITKVIAKKIINGVPVAIIDGSALHLGIPNPYKAIIHKGSLNTIRKQLIVGCSCKESDVLGEVDNSCEINVGDIIVYENIGAYTIDKCNDYIIKKPYLMWNHPFL